MPAWAFAIAVIWTVAGFAVAFVVGKVSRDAPTARGHGPAEDAPLVSALAAARWTDEEAQGVEPKLPRLGGTPLRVLVVDDDADLRTLIRVSFEAGDIEVEEAESANSAVAVVETWRPDVVVLDIAMPGVDGVTLCRQLKADPNTRDIAVVLLTGASDLSGEGTEADAFLRKPFSPLALLATVERLGSRAVFNSPPPVVRDPADKQLLLYAQDFRRLLDLEQGQRRLLESAYRETTVALAHALEAKDGSAAPHSERVRRYATELARAADDSLRREPSLEYGFILHDIGKIGIPEAILTKAEPLSQAERRVLETHPVLGEQMISNAALLRGHGASVVRSHHERWDGGGYPDGLSGEEIPLGARIFAVADALDAMTSDRPYRQARSWPDAAGEIMREAGTQFDPEIADLFREREAALRRIYYEVRANPHGSGTTVGASSFEG